MKVIRPAELGRLFTTWACSSACIQTRCSWESLSSTLPTIGLKPLASPTDTHQSSPRPLSRESSTLITGCQMVLHFNATERYLPCGITQCYLPPDTGECAPQAGSRFSYTGEMAVWVNLGVWLYTEMV